MNNPGQTTAYDRLVIAQRLYTDHTPMSDKTL